MKACPQILQGYCVSVKPCFKRMCRWYVPLRYLPRYSVKQPGCEQYMTSGTSECVVLVGEYAPASEAALSCEERNP